jgi:hypothetical protein
MRFWTPDDIYEVRCPHCGNDIEFFKDEPALTCRSCRNEVRNPRIDLGCARWCRSAGECLGGVPGKTDSTAYLCDRLIDSMREVFGEDRKRIDHALGVLEYADQILESEKGLSAIVVRAAAILHDIGIHAAERKHGSSAPRFQELEGPPIARGILERHGVEPAVVEHVCRIIANHHSARDIDTPEFRVVRDADWLVNIPNEFDLTDRPRIERLVSRVFKTERGKDIARRELLREID